MATINWNVSKEADELITDIMERVFRDIPKLYRDRLECHMHLTACHANGCELDLRKLLDAPAFDFAHDIGGIRRHLNRTTGKLEDCFLPRCAKPQRESVPPTVGGLLKLIGDMPNERTR